MKKLTALILALTMALSLISCGKAAAPAAPAEESAASSAPAAVANPMTEVTEEEMTTAVGIALPAPEGAEHPQWFTIDMGEDGVMGEVQFTLNGKDSFVRALFTSEVSLDACPDISGLNYDFETADTTVQGRDAKVYTCADGGYISMLDVVPGVVYAFGIVGEAAADDLQALADTTFVPMQGEVDGDVEAVTDVDWKGAYEAVLAGMGEEDAAFYLLYDVDGDALPEMLVRHVPNEAEADLSIYDVDADGTANEVAQFPASQTVLCGLSAEGTVLLHAGHMGVESVDKLVYENGAYSTVTVMDVRELGEGDEYLPLSQLDYYEAADPAGLEWNGNSVDENDAVMAEIAQ